MQQEKQNKFSIIERTFDFSVKIIKLCNTLDKTNRAAEILCKQILRSGTSIGANLEEGQAAQSRSDFIHKYNIALKEARETSYWLRLLAKSEIAQTKRLSGLIQESKEITLIIAKIITNTKNNSLV